MRLRKGIAIFGPTCVGKTAIAARLAVACEQQAHHCGEQVKARRKALGRDLTLQEHRDLDNETCRIVTEGVRTIVEGSFLDRVLAASGEGVALVRLDCALRERERRAASRGGNGSDYVAERDRQDAELKRHLYGENSLRAEAAIAIDTTGLTVEQVVESILLALGDES